MQDRTHDISRPLIGITMDLAEVSGGRFRAECSAAYSDAVAAAGGLPVLLSPDTQLALSYARLCDGFVFTGGDDPKMEQFGEATHPAAKPIHPRRQAFETALLQALERDFPAKPVLGVCLGMQMMALLAGGQLDQHLPETYDLASRHQRQGPAGDRASHPILIDRHAASAAGMSWLGDSANPGPVDSHHHQAVSDSGALVVVGRSDDGLIEAIAAPGGRRPSRPFFLGVQWHPERTRTEAFGAELFRRIVLAAAGGIDPRPVAH